jgi:hypothetical protein
VLGHGAFGDEQALRDGRVGASLGHQGEHLALARAERGGGAVAGVGYPGSSLLRSSLVSFGVPIPPVCLPAACPQLALNPRMRVYLGLPLAWAAGRRPALSNLVGLRLRN